MHMPPRRYEIIVRGRLSRRREAALGGVTLEASCGHTVLRVEVVDGSQLYGLLEQLRDLGLELISVNAVIRDGNAG